MKMFALLNNTRVQGPGRLYGITTAKNLKQAKRRFNRVHYQSRYGVEEGLGLKMRGTRYKKSQFNYFYTVQPIRIEKIKALEVKF